MRTSDTAHGAQGSTTHRRRECNDPRDRTSRLSPVYIACGVGERVSRSAPAVVSALVRVAHPQADPGAPSQ